MASSDLNPLGSIYKSFRSLLKGTTIKYLYKAAEYDTFDVKHLGDQYLNALNKKDNFFIYRDYSKEEMKAVGIRSEDIFFQVEAYQNIEAIPEEFRENLLLNRRKYIIDNYEEQNDYYRMYNGYPPLAETKFFYLDKETADWAGVDDISIPIHKIQDHYNRKEPGKGDFIIHIVEGTKYIEKLIEENPTVTYLQYIGSRRISIETLRTSKNFQIIQINGREVPTILFDNFLTIYEQCRTYFCTNIYNHHFINTIPYYDNFIAMCIMIMTMNNLIMKQISLSISREFYDKAAVRALYEAYNIPFNIMLDEETQSNIVQNLNLMIQNKATDKVIYDIAGLLGFGNINVYKYYLVKNRNFDAYGVPIVEYIEKFDNTIGEYVTVYDYEKMYELYFQKAELKDLDFSNNADNNQNILSYKAVTENDPFWHEDSYVYNRIYETEFNYVESKYLSLGIMYSMTDLVFDNTLLLKTLLQLKSEISDISIQIPKITGDVLPVPLFDIIVLLICLTAAKHELKGEIITKPSQVLAVLDYNSNIDNSELLVDTLSFNFELFEQGNTELEDFILEMKENLSESVYKEFEDYLIKFRNIRMSINNEDKIKGINDLFTDMKNFYKFIEYQMSISKSRKDYEMFKRLHKAAFYSREMSDIFKVKYPNGEEKVPKTYFEYLYHLNPKLYYSVFKFSLAEEYTNYLHDNNITPLLLSYEDFITKVENEEIVLYYDTLKNEVIEDTDTKDEYIYFYVNHIIGKLSSLITSVDYINLMGESTSPLEDLLLKLLRHFKSYTVDIIGIDHTYICDFKSANTVKLFDDINYMRKVISMRDYYKMNHSDVVSRIEINSEVEDGFVLTDKAKYEVNVELIETIVNRFIKDEVNNIKKDIQIDEKQYLYDGISFSRSTINVQMDDGFKLRDRVMMYYS